MSKELDFDLQLCEIFDELPMGIKTKDEVIKHLKALEIIKKYVYIKDLGEDNGDFFGYYIEDKQYVSSRSCNVMSKEEYELLKEVLK